jgi:cytochrome c556
MHQRKFVWVGLLTLLGLFVAAELFAQADVIEQRQKLMKSNSEAAKAIKAAAEAKDYATVEAKAKDIMGNEAKIFTFFPKGSTTGKTKATPAIWEKPDDFAKASKGLQRAASELAAAAKSGNEAEINVKVKALGEACGSCHKAFRAEKYSE